MYSYIKNIPKTYYKRYLYSYKRFVIRFIFGNTASLCEPVISAYFFWLNFVGMSNSIIYLLHIYPPRNLAFFIKKINVLLVKRILPTNLWEWEWVLICCLHFNILPSLWVVLDYRYLFLLLYQWRYHYLHHVKKWNFVQFFGFFLTKILKNRYLNQE